MGPIDDERRWMEESDRRTEERNKRLDEEWEYRDTAPGPEPATSEEDDK